MGVKSKENAKKKTADGESEQFENKFSKWLCKSPINYFSDLFIVTMVLGWVGTVILMSAAAMYALMRFEDTSIWGEVGSLVEMPLSCGGAIWMVKNSVQHAIANNSGKRAHMDFPKVNADGEDDGNEELIGESDD